MSQIVDIYRPKVILWLRMAVLTLLLVSECAGIWSVAAENKVAAPATVKPLDVEKAPERDYSLENRTIDFNRRVTKKETSDKPEEKVSGGGATAVMVMVVAVIGVLFWMGLTIFRKFLPGGRTLFACSAMEVLGRTHIEQQKYLTLVRVGKRLLVVGVSPSGFDNLAEIIDEEEVADMMAVAAPKNIAGKNLFHRIFQKQLQQADNEVVPEDKSMVNSGLEDIQARIRSLREQE